MVEKSTMKSRWKKYFENLMNEENCRKNEKVTKTNKMKGKIIKKEEVPRALKKMKNKAVDPNEILIEARKALGTKGI